MGNSPQDLLRLALTVSDVSLIGYNRTSLSASLVDLGYLMPSSGAPALLAQRGLGAGDSDTAVPRLGSKMCCHCGDFPLSIPPRAEKMTAPA